MSNCLLSLVVSLPGIIIICGFIALFCIVLFDSTPAHGKVKAVKKLKELGKTEYDIHKVNPNAPQEEIEFGTADLVVKVDKEISPDSNVYLDISPKEQFLPGISTRVDPNSSVWHVQVMTDALEDRSSDEQSCALTVQYLHNTLRIFLEMISDTSQKTGDMRSSTISKNRRTK